MKDLGRLAGSETYVLGLNDSGQAVGKGFLSDDTTTHAFYYDGSALQDLGSLGPGSSWASGINNYGQAVGGYVAIGGAQRGFLYTTSGGMVDLNNMLSANPLGAVVTGANGISPSGRIAGDALISGHTHAVMLTPVPSINSLSPRTVQVRGPSVALTVSGNGFLPESVVKWNGSVLSTTFVSPFELHATVPAGSITAAGTAKVVVQTPGIGGSTSKAASTSVLPLLKSVSCSPASVTGGASAQGTVTLNFPAGPGGVDVVLSADSASVHTDAATHVPEGALSAGFAASTQPVTSLALCTFSASLQGVARTCKLSVKPPALASIKLSPSTVKGGVGATATVTLTGPAPEGGINVALSSNTAAAWMAGSVQVDAGNRSAAAQILTSSVPATTLVAISAALGGITKSATLKLTPQ